MLALGVGTDHKKRYLFEKIDIVDMNRGRYNTGNIIFKTTDYFSLISRLPLRSLDKQTAYSIIMTGSAQINGIH